MFMKIPNQYFITNQPPPPVYTPEIQSVKLLSPIIQYLEISTVCFPFHLKISTQHKSQPSLNNHLGPQLATEL